MRSQGKLFQSPDFLEGSPNFERVLGKIDFRCITFKKLLINLDLDKKKLTYLRFYKSFRTYL